MQYKHFIVKCITLSLLCFITLLGKRGHEQISLEYSLIGYTKCKVAIQIHSDPQMFNKLLTVKLNVRQLLENKMFPICNY